MWISSSGPDLGHHGLSTVSRKKGYRDKIPSHFMLSVLSGEETGSFLWSHSFCIYPVVSSLPISLCHQELCCASGLVPSYLKASGLAGESASSVSLQWLPLPITSGMDVFSMLMILSFCVQNLLLEMSSFSVAEKEETYVVLGTELK